MLRFAKLDEELERPLGRRVDLVTKRGLDALGLGECGPRSAGGVCPVGYPSVGADSRR
jgi:hypothetical protein